MADPRPQPHLDPQKNPPPAQRPQPHTQPQPDSSTQQNDSDSPRNKDGGRLQQKDVDKERTLGANASGNWRREEGEVIGENPASIDFVGAYPWPNVCEPGENRDDFTPIVPPIGRDEEIQETVAEEQRRKSEMDARASRKAADRRKDDKWEKEYPTSPQSAFRTQREKDEQNAKGRDHSANRPADHNRPQA